MGKFYCLIIWSTIQRYTRGGYIFGNATEFTGNDILRESGGGVVLVIAQYRLGVFGFLAGQKVKDDGELNAGLRTSSFFPISFLLKLIRKFVIQLAIVDQQFALKWVQEHVRTPAISITIYTDILF